MKIRFEVVEEDGAIAVKVQGNFLGLHEVLNYDSPGLVEYCELPTEKSKEYASWLCETLNKKAGKSWISVTKIGAGRVEYEWKQSAKGALCIDYGIDPQLLEGIWEDA